MPAEGRPWPSNDNNIGDADDYNDDEDEDNDDDDDDDDNDDDDARQYAETSAPVVSPHLLSK